MGAVWVLLEPIAHLAVISIFFSLLRGDTLADIEYPVFILTGLAPFLLFRNIALRLMNSVRENRSLFSYKQIKPLDVFIARTIVESSLAAMVYALLVFAFAWFGFDMSVQRPMEWLLVLALGIVFSFSLGVLLSLIVDALPDSKLFLRMMFFPLYFMSGVLFPPSYFPPEFMPLLLLNPFLHLLELIRASIFPFYVAVDGVSVQFVLSVTLVLLFASMGTYRVRRLHLISTKNG